MTLAAVEDDRHLRQQILNSQCKQCKSAIRTEKKMILSPRSTELSQTTTVHIVHIGIMTDIQKTPFVRELASSGMLPFRWQPYSENYHTDMFNFQTAKSATRHLSPSHYSCARATIFLSRTSSSYGRVSSSVCQRCYILNWVYMNSEN